MVVIAVNHHNQPQLRLLLFTLVLCESLWLMVGPVFAIYHWFRSWAEEEIKVNISGLWIVVLKVVASSAFSPDLGL